MRISERGDKMNKQALIRAIVKSDLTGRQKMYLEELVKSARVGMWIREEDSELGEFYKCSICGSMALYCEYPLQVLSKYCPECGAKMRYD